MAFSPCTASRGCTAYCHTRHYTFAVLQMLKSESIRVMSMRCTLNTPPNLLLTTTPFLNFRIVKVRETRLTGIVSHILIGLSVFLIPYPMAYIPTAVLNGLFLYMAITSLNGNQMFERITLLFMEQVLERHFRTLPKTPFLPLGRLSAESLHSPVSSAQDSHVHPLSTSSTGNDVLLWLLPMALHQDGLSCHRHSPLAIQVSSLPNTRQKSALLTFPLPP